MLDNNELLIKDIATINVGDLEFGKANLADKLDINELESGIAGNNINRRDFGEFSLFKYSDLAMMRWAWNPTNMRTRGLIIDNNSNEIVARGFNKFFNYDQLVRLGVDVDVNESGWVMDKLDGSLGIAFKHNGSWIVSTAGSLQSEQAVFATKLMNEKYADTPFEQGKSLLFEIIFPENRIVTNYNGLSDLVLLGAVDINGFWISPDDVEWSGLRADKKRGSIKDALGAKDPEDGTEGFVIRTDSGLLVKIKFPHYLDLHRAKFGLTKKTVWTAIKDDTYNSMLLSTPDEFQDDMKKLHDEIMSDFNAIAAEVDAFGASIPNSSRKDKVLWIKNAPGVSSRIKSLAITKFVAGNDIRVGIMKVIKQEGLLK